MDNKSLIKMLSNIYSSIELGFSDEEVLQHIIGPSIKIRRVS